MSLQHLILGVLKYGPMSGYDLNKTFQASVQHFWDTEQSLIYRALHKLHDQGWVDVDVVPQADLPARKVYRLTEPGQAELRRWLATPEPLPALHEAWLGQLFFGAELEPEKLRRLLEARIEMIRALLEHYEKDVPESAANYATRFAAPQDVAYWLLTLNYGIEKFRFDLHWAETALKTVEQLARRGEAPPHQSS